MFSHRDPIFLLKYVLSRLLQFCCMWKMVKSIQCIDDSLFFGASVGFTNLKTTFESIVAQMFLKLSVADLLYVEKATFVKVTVTNIDKLFQHYLKPQLKIYLCNMLKVLLPHDL